jgi:hypothetical protein
MTGNQIVTGEKLTTNLQNQRTLLIIDTLDNARTFFPKK